MKSVYAMFENPSVYLAENIPFVISAGNNESMLLLFKEILASNFRNDNKNISTLYGLTSESFYC
jgi:hypothetical protein